jgi:hypothetical protein
MQKEVRSLKVLQNALSKDAFCNVTRERDLGKHAQFSATGLRLTGLAL